MLIHKHKHGEVYMRASWIFSANDIITNMGVIIRYTHICWLDSVPDIVIGIVISVAIL